MKIIYYEQNYNVPKLTDFVSCCNLNLADASLLCDMIQLPEENKNFERKH